MPDLVVDIAVNIAVHKTFHYRVPEEMRDRLVPGSRVLVPFGNRRIEGTVIGFPGKAGVEGLKSVSEMLDNPLAPGLLALARWISDYYLHPLGQTIDALVPKALSRAKPKKKRYLQIAEGDHDMGSIRGPKQRDLLLLLCDRQIICMEDLEGFAPATIRSLCDAKMATIIEKETEGRPDNGEFSPSVPPELMPAQSEAVRRINESIAGKAFGVFLLHGVTGSGKTEVYLHAISGLANTGKGAIVLVPEIALTPQLLSRFRQRFGDRVAVLHSGLTDRERADEYRRIQAGQVDVAIGARSAVFAPFEKVGLIIVDEEHENSYKQDEGLRYNARDVAIMRAKFQNAVAVLGSATPSLESYYNAKSGKYQYLRLANRVDHRPMPEVPSST